MHRFRGDLYSNFELHSPRVYYMPASTRHYEGPELLLLFYHESPPLLGEPVRDFS